MKKRTALAVLLAATITAILFFSISASKASGECPRHPDDPRYAECLNFSGDRIVLDSSYEGRGTCSPRWRFVCVVSGPTTPMPMDSAIIFQVGRNGRAKRFTGLEENVAVKFIWKLPGQPAVKWVGTYNSGIVDFGENGGEWWLANGQLHKISE